MIVYKDDSLALLNMVIVKSTKVKSFKLKQGNATYKFMWNEDKDWFFVKEIIIGWNTTLRFKSFKDLVKNNNFVYIEINIKPIVNK